MSELLPWLDLAWSHSGSCRPTTTLTKQAGLGGLPHRPPGWLAGLLQCQAGWQAGLLVPAVLLFCQMFMRACISVHRHHHRHPIPRHLIMQLCLLSCEVHPSPASLAALPHAPGQLHSQNLAGLHGNYIASSQQPPASCCTSCLLFLRACWPRLGGR